MKKNLMPLLLIAAVIFITAGCPYASKVPIDKSGAKINKNLLGKWIKATDKEKENPEYFVISEIDPQKYSIVKFEYKTTDSSYKETKYVSHISLIENISFLNMQKGGNGDYYLHKIDMANNEFTLFEVTDNIDEKFGTSAELKAFIKENMRLSFFYNKDEKKYIRQ